MDGSTTDSAALRIIADYQFGAGAGRALFPDDEAREIERSRSGRPRQIHATAGRLVSLGTDGRFSLGLEGGRRLHEALAAPTCRVELGAESEPYVAAGRNGMARFVRSVDPAIRARDEVLVVGPEDGLLGVGRAELPASAMLDFDVGVAVKVRHGRDDG